MNRRGGEVITFANLEGDAIEIIVCRFAGQHLALLPHEEFADVTEQIPINIVHFFACAGKFFVVFGLEILLLVVIAEDVLAGIAHEDVRELRKAIIVWCAVRIG